MRFAFIIVLFSGYTNISVSAQEYSYKHYDLANGLSGLTVYATAQDHNGYMWFGTETGLSRFDGSKFKNFTTDDGLPDNEILKIYVDSKNRIWLLPFTNAICYYKDGVIYSSQNDTLLNKLKLTTEPQDIVEDACGNIIIITAASIYIMTINRTVKRINDINTTNFITLKVGINNNGNAQVSAMLKNKGDNWGIIEINHSTLNSSFIKISDESKNISSLSFILQPDIVVYQKIDDIHIINKKNKSERIFHMPDNFIGLSFIDNSVFTMNCNDRTLIYDLESNSIKDSFVLGKMINNVFKDSEGSYWIGTTGYGIYRLTSFAFKNYTITWNGNSLPVYALQKKDNFLYAGSNHSLLWKIDLINKSQVPTQFNVLYGEGRVSAITNTKEDIVVGIDGIHYLHPDGSIEKKDSGRTVKQISMAGNDVLVTTNRGAFLFSKNGNIIKDTLWKERCTCIKKFGDTYFIGTLRGLFLVDGRKKTDLGKQHPLLGSRISAIEKQGSVVWITTYGNGVIVFNGMSVTRHITDKNGLSSNMCRNLVVSNDYVWVGTDKGLNRISVLDTATPIVKYSSNNGLNCDIINNLIIDHDTIYIATPYGLSSFIPNKVPDSSISILNLESIVSGNMKWNLNERNIHLSASNNRLAIEYSCVSFKSLGNIIYNYKFAGIDNRVQRTKETSLEFLSLKPGYNELHLYAVNAFGKKSNEIVIGITVSKFFYQETWFIFLISTIILLTGWFIISKRIRNIRQGEQEKLRTQRRLSELEQIALRSQMNPHFIFNCLNSIQQYIFTKSVFQANQFISEFASLIRQTMELSAKTFITLEEEIKYLSTYLKLEYIRFDDSFTYNIVNDVEAETFHLPPLLLQPFVENSIRHGIRNHSKKGEIQITFKKNNGYVQCIIQDNGIGRILSQQLNKNNNIEHQSKGMSIVEKRISELNYNSKLKTTLIIEDAFPGDQYPGTRIILEMPDHL